MQWFKHESNANTDDKLQNVLLDYGLEGYGLYWYCLELIVNRVDKDNITFELKHDARIIARNTGCSVQKVEEMMKRFVELGLFESSEGAITCIKLLKRMDSSMTSNAFMRDLIINAKKHHDAIMTQSGNVMQDKKRIDKKRIDKDITQKNDFFADIDSQLVEDYLAVRKAKRAPKVSKTVYDGLLRESKLAGIDLSQALRVCVERNWVGFKADWYVNQKKEIKEDLGWRNNDNQILLKAQALKIYTQGKNRYELLAAIDAKNERQKI